jgi:CheY-like chemotaxis protein
VVDDYERYRLILKELVASLGGSVHEACDGEQAIAEAARALTRGSLKLCCSTTGHGRSAGRLTIEESGG